GNLSIANTDVDNWSFSANAGDTLVVAAENPGSPSSSGLLYDLLDVNGNRVTGGSYFYTDANGRGQSPPVTLPYTGTYFVHVSQNYAYEGEYRFRATLAAAGTQIETETNDATGNANIPALTLQNSGGLAHQVATVAGYISLPDPGDYYKLGNLGAATAITLNL